jgi:hypothetical protein
MSLPGQLQVLEQKQTKRQWLFTAETMARFRVNSCEIRGGRSGTAAGLSPSLFGVPVLIVTPPLLQMYRHDSPVQAAKLPSPLSLRCRHHL